ncbi:12062_t:CDS:2 [Funneliformis geosporum]|uniref:12062_t:CDS:1 n=1 Tax=Funneliformis geosporum TaxID=1117311 RepID=A0A9W4SMY7_9GLOM|nr:12062_t:CDS:2 [Funneliformis geosporum]
MTKLHEITGQIISKEPRKVYKKNEFYGNINYKLKVLPEKRISPEYETIFVYANLVDPPLLKILKQNQYLDQRYFFTCQRKRNDALYNLVENLKEILKLLQDQPIKGRYDEFGQPLYKEGLCSLVDEYHSDEEENEDI